VETNGLHGNLLVTLGGMSCSRSVAELTDGIGTWPSPKRRMAHGRIDSFRETDSR
jgi:hypothetical protein